MDCGRAQRARRRRTRRYVEPGAASTTARRQRVAARSRRVGRPSGHLSATTRSKPVAMTVTCTSSPSAGSVTTPKMMLAWSLALSRIRLAASTTSMRPRSLPPVKSSRMPVAPSMLLSSISGLLSYASSRSTRGAEYGEADGSVKDEDSGSTIGTGLRSARCPRIALRSSSVYVYVSWDDDGFSSRGSSANVQSPCRPFRRLPRCTSIPRRTPARYGTRLPRRASGPERTSGRCTPACHRPGCRRHCSRNRLHRAHPRRPAVDK